MDALGANLDALGANLDALGANLSALRADLDALGANLDALGANLGALGANLDALGPNLGALGRLLGSTGELVGSVGRPLDCQHSKPAAPELAAPELDKTSANATERQCNVTTRCDEKNTKLLQMQLNDQCNKTLRRWISTGAL